MWHKKAEYHENRGREQDRQQHHSARLRQRRPLDGSDEKGVFESGCEKSTSVARPEARSQVIGAVAVDPAPSGEWATSGVVGEVSDMVSPYYVGSFMQK